MTNTLIHNPEEATENTDQDTTRITSELQTILDEADTERERHAYFSGRAKEIGRRVDPNVEDVASYFGVDAELANGAISDTELIKPSIRIAHRMSASQFQSLLVDGQLKSYQETGYSGGSAKVVKNDSGTDSVRRKYEDDNDLRRDGEPPVIHGFLEDVDGIGERGQAFAYGPLEIVLRKDILERSVYTDGDSGLTQKYPLDFETALIAKSVRDRLHQRPNDYRLGDMYTEAIILGGVTLGDVDSIIIDSTGKQGGEREEENQVPKTPEDIEKSIQQLHDQLPDVALTYKIAAETLFQTKKILELATKYPDVQFIGAINGTSGAGVESPFRALGTPEAAAAEPVAFEEITSRAAYSYETAAARRDLLQQRLQEHQEAVGTDKPVPGNISFSLRNDRY